MTLISSEKNHLIYLDKFYIYFFLQILWIWNLLKILFKNIYQYGKRCDTHLFRDDAS